MRLIDADELMTVTDVREDGTEVTYVPYSEIEDAPTAYDPDKVAEQLENERKFWENAYDSNLGKEKARSYEHAIQIVKGGGVDGN